MKTKIIILIIILILLTQCKLFEFEDSPTYFDGTWKVTVIEGAYYNMFGLVTVGDDCKFEIRLLTTSSIHCSGTEVSETIVDGNLMYDNKKVGTFKGDIINRHGWFLKFHFYPVNESEEFLTHFVMITVTDENIDGIYEGTTRYDFFNNHGDTIDLNVTVQRVN